MDEQQNIQPMQSDFEQIKKTDADGKNYWSARELSNVMGYSTWQKFNRVLNKALQVAQSRGMNISEHFNQTVEMVKLGSGTFRKVLLQCTDEHAYAQPLCRTRQRGTPATQNRHGPL